MYVASYYDNCVSVFTTEGEYVTSKYGSGECDFINPIGVCVEKDGYVRFLFVCVLSDAGP